MSNQKMRNAKTEKKTSSRNSINENTLKRIIQEEVLRSLAISKNNNSIVENVLLERQILNEINIFQKLRSVGSALKSALGGKNYDEKLLKIIQDDFKKLVSKQVAKFIKDLEKTGVEQAQAEKTAKEIFAAVIEDIYIALAGVKMPKS